MTSWPGPARLCQAFGLDRRRRRRRPRDGQPRHHHRRRRHAAAGRARSSAPASGCRRAPTCRGGGARPARRTCRGPREPRCTHADAARPAPSDLAAARAAVVAARPGDADHEANRARILAFLDEHPDALHRSCPEGHLTGSAAVVDPSTPPGAAPAPRQGAPLAPARRSRRRRRQPRPGRAPRGRGGDRDRRASRSSTPAIDLDVHLFHNAAGQRARPPPPRRPPPRARAPGGRGDHQPRVRRASRGCPVDPDAGGRSTSTTGHAVRMVRGSAGWRGPRATRRRGRCSSSCLDVDRAWRRRSSGCRPRRRR